MWIVDTFAINNNNKCHLSYKILNKDNWILKLKVICAAWYVNIIEDKVNINFKELEVILPEKSYIFFLFALIGMVPWAYDFKRAFGLVSLLV